MLRLFVHRMDLSIQPTMLEDYYDVEVDHTLKIIGRIDRADTLEDGSLHVIDYKTGRHQDEDGLRTQLLIYSFIIGQSTSRPVVRASSLFLRNFQWFSLEPTDDDFQELVRSLKEKVTAIQSDRTFPARVGDHCRFCDFQSICPKQEEVKRHLAAVKS